MPAEWKELDQDSQRTRSTVTDRADSVSNCDEIPQDENGSYEPASAEDMGGNGSPTLDIVEISVSLFVHLRNRF